MRLLHFHDSPWSQYLEYPACWKVVWTSIIPCRACTLPATLLIYLTARELTLDAAQAARSSRGTLKTLPPAQIKKLLDSRNDRDVLEGLRKVIAVRLPWFGEQILPHHAK